jgi:hypothetical protein
MVVGLDVVLSTNRNLLNKPNYISSLFEIQKQTKIYKMIYINIFMKIK